jgi:hypothetical protein
MRKATDDLAASFGRSGDDLLGFATHIDSILKGLGFTQTAAEGMSTQITTLGVDFGKAFHVSDADAIRAIESAMEGNTRGLREYGIAINDSTMKQFEHAKGVDTDISSMNAAQKAYLTYQFLLSQTNDIQKTAAKNTGDLDDEVKRLGAAWQEMLQIVGTPILGIVSTTFQGVVSILQTVEQAIQIVGKEWTDLMSLLGMKLGISMVPVDPTQQQRRFTGDGKAEAFNAADGTVDYTRDNAEGAKIREMNQSLNDQQDAALKAADGTKQLQDQLSKLGELGGGSGSDSASKKLEELKNTLESLGHVRL